ncbi:MAG TPA: hypothetical protein VEI48_03385 [Candidatus Sulfotelmatobacter sp.]|nr:hypothetical protein [Candidatus Sulfotelmatobacter sp.]
MTRDGGPRFTAIDQTAMPWLDKRLDVRPGIGRLLKVVVRRSPGRFEALLPDGATPSTLRLDEAFPTSPAWGLVSADAIIAERLVDALHEFPQGSCVFPDTLGSAGEPWIAELPNDHGLLDHRGELYHYVPRAASSVEAVMRLVLWANVAWGGYGFVTSGPALPAPSMPARAITEGTLAELAGGVRLITARAFDNLSRVVWVRGDRP